MKILLADDEKSITVTLSDELHGAGHEVTVASTGLAALDQLQRQEFDCLIADIRMPGMDGLELLKRSKEKWPDIEVIVMTGYGSVESAVQALKTGAIDYLEKPFLNEEMLLCLKRIEEERRLRQELRVLRAELAGRDQFGKLIGKSRKMRDVYELVEAVAPQDCNVVIEGENGTGKEIVADEIHVRSPRKGGPLVKMSCSTFVETLLEDELFGHEKGAFTDARDLKIGRFERANNGTIFIDDIDDMPLHTQVKLLRVLQEREFERLGGTRTVKINIRVICATKVDLGKAVREGKFREDLFFRLNVVTLKLPALRERDGDIPILLAHFMQKYGKGEKYELKPQTLAGLENYRWPGNVRELEHSVERAIVLAGNSHELKKEHLLKISPEESPEQLMKVDLRALRGVVAESEARHIRAVLEHTKGHKGEAAEILGISRKNLWEKMKEYGLE